MPRSFTPPAQPLARVLADDPLLAAWDRRRRDEAKVTKAVRGSLPHPMAPHVTAWLAEPGRLDLVATTGAVAAALRQRLPIVGSALEREGWNFRELRVRVQPVSAQGESTKPVPRQWDSTHFPALAGLAAGLPDGPLKIAVTGWLRRSGR
jgi:hypothetical protein